MLVQFATVFVFLALAIVFVMVALSISWMLRPKKPSPEKQSTYECGEEPEGSPCVQFNLRFYLIALFFIVFDVEMIFLLPWAVAFNDMLAELGANVVKTYFVPGFEQVTAGCPVPIVIAGGKKLPELDALTMAYNAVQQGAAGVDMGRNIFQSDAPHAMLAAVNAVVHENMKPKEALELYGSLKAEGVA